MTLMHTQYFCIAPKSHSSPIAAAAAAHPQVTCVSCTDERSLAFAALGYARGASKAAVLVTTSGTEIPNLLPAVGLLPNFTVF
jgi:2-succinyl-5-enolpyruvyl-6-hydroxy-3-cyclohexene-1-carboxylate synthase